MSFISLEEAIHSEYMLQVARAKKMIISWQQFKNCLKSPLTLWYTLKVVICLYLNKSLVSKEYTLITSWDNFDDAMTALVVGKGLLRGWGYNIIVEDLSEATE